MQFLKYVNIASTLHFLQSYLHVTPRFHLELPPVLKPLERDFNSCIGNG